MACGKSLVIKAPVAVKIPQQQLQGFWRLAVFAIRLQDGETGWTVQHLHIPLREFEITHLANCEVLIKCKFNTHFYYSHDSCIALDKSVC